MNIDALFKSDKPEVDLLSAFVAQVQRVQEDVSRIANEEDVRVPTEAAKPGDPSKVTRSAESAAEFRPTIGGQFPRLDVEAFTGGTRYRGWNSDNRLHA